MSFLLVDQLEPIRFPRRRLGPTAPNLALLVAFAALALTVGCERQRTMTESADNFEDEEEGEFLPPGPEVTKKLFKKWRSPRFGTANPERMDNPVWEWLIKSRMNAYLANDHFKGPDPFDAGPGWCFDRHGQSVTQLPDGRALLIAGEHEDSYDPDFDIYNDVVVRHPDGPIKIYGYPESVFPPTDFHSATLVEDRIILIGSLGYPEERQYGFTQIRILDLETLSISSVEPKGTAPGWIHEHKASLSEDGRSILIERGKLQRADENTLVENIDDWRLHLGDWRWERLTERNWKRWELTRKDAEMNQLWEYQQADWEAKLPELNLPDGDLAQMRQALDIPTLEENLGGPPDLKLFASLYQPPLKFEALPDSDEEFGVKRIRIDCVTVRYVQDSHSIQMTVEGGLPQGTLDTLTGDLTEKLSTLEQAECVLRQL
jgi:hypothetical protein